MHKKEEEEMYCIKMQFEKKASVKEERCENFGSSSISSKWPVKTFMRLNTKKLYVCQF